VSDSGTSIAAIGLTLAALATGPLGLVVTQPAAVRGDIVVKFVGAVAGD
jgi:hypothetical protein